MPDDRPYLNWSGDEIYDRSTTASNPDEIYQFILEFLQRRGTDKNRSMLRDVVGLYHRACMYQINVLTMERRSRDVAHDAVTEDGYWPTTQIIEGNIKFEDGVFRRLQSPLNICGYKVGAHGLSQPRRRKILDEFYSSRLHRSLEELFPGELGQPNTMKRLLKMANIIAANCRNFKRNDAHDYRQAIREWEADLSYLKEKYYDTNLRNRPPWPRT